MKALRTHGGPHAVKGGETCEVGTCRDDHVEFLVMGEAGTARYSCQHQVHTVTWFADTPVGHCKLDRHPDEIGRCPQGCVMTVEPVSGA